MHEEPVAQNEVTLRDYIDLLLRRKAIILQTFVAAVFIGIAVSMITRPVYSSTGRLLVIPASPFSGVRPGDDPLTTIAGSNATHNVPTQLEVLMTPFLVAQAFQASNLSPNDNRVKPIISRANDDIDIIDVTIEAHKPDIAESVANNLMELYIEQDKKWRTGDIDSAIKFATSELAIADQKRKQTGIDMTSFRDQKKITDYNTMIQARTQALELLKQKQQSLQSDINGMQAAIDTMTATVLSVPATITKKALISNPNIEVMRRDLSVANGTLARMKALFKDDHPAVKSALEQVHQLEKDIASTPREIPNNEEVTNPEIKETEGKLHGLQAQKETLLASLQTVTAQKNEADAGLKSLSAQQYKQSALLQDADLAQNHYKDLSTKLDDLRLKQVALPKTITILNRAPLNPDAVRPRRPLIIALAGIAGLFLGVCFALLQEFLDDRVNAPEDARRLLGVPALGYIPKVEKEEHRLLTSERAGGSLLESYRVLRSNVRFAAVGEPLNSIMVTSTAPGEGKSMTSCNLAIAIALDGKRVILVDADLRRPTVHEKFGVRNTPGLTNVLVGALSIEKALQDTDIENLQILTSGPIPPNPAELLNSNAMEQVQELLKEHADVIIYDTPPCLSVADAQVMAATVDGLIYVVQLGSTRKSALRHGHELLRHAHARILGVVYNKVEINKGRNDYYGYYSYYHKTELTGKADGNGNGRKNKHDDEWEALTSQAKDTSSTAIAATESSSSRRASTMGSNGSRSDTSKSEKE